MSFHRHSCASKCCAMKYLTSLCNGIRFCSNFGIVTIPNWGIIAELNKSSILSFIPKVLPQSFDYFDFFLHGGSLIWILRNTDNCNLQQPNHILLNLWCLRSSMSILLQRNPHRQPTITSVEYQLKNHWQSREKAFFQ